MESERVKMKATNILCLAALLCFVFVDISATAENEIKIGTPESHKWLWDKYSKQLKHQSDIDRQINNETQKIADLKKRIDEIDSRIKTNQNNLGAEIVVVKNEFETTEEWRSRCAETNANQKRVIAADNTNYQLEIKNLKSEIEKQQGQVAFLKKASTESSEQKSISLPTKVTFLVKVRMGKYNADTSSIDGFYLYDRAGIDGYPYFLTVGKNENIPAIFDFKGDTTQLVKSLTVSRERAKAMRAASDNNKLWASFTSKPLAIEYWGKYKVHVEGHSYTYTEKRSGPLPSVSTIAANMFLAAMGAPAGVEDQPEKKTGYAPAYDKEISAKIIGTGWDGTPTIQAFYTYNESMGELELIQ